MLAEWQMLAKWQTGKMAKHGPMKLNIISAQTSALWFPQLERPHKSALLIGAPPHWRHSGGQETPVALDWR